MTNYEKVREFHEIYKCATGEIGKPDISDKALMNLRKGLVDEEYQELLQALEEDNIVEVADALGDLLYVIYGWGITIGLDMDAIVAEIHRSNLSKLGADGKPIYREDGKVLKGPDFTQPNLKPIVFKEKENENV